MNNEKRRRSIRLDFWVTPEEKAQIEEKMKQIGTSNMSAYIRKIAIDGSIIKVDIPGIRTLMSLLRRTGNKLNQLTKRVQETTRIYDIDLEDLHVVFHRILDAAVVIVSTLTAIE